MRPHTFAALAVFFYFLKRPNEKKYNFLVQMLGKKDSHKSKLFEYDIQVLENTSEVIKLRIGRMWTCELEIRREKIGSDKFVIKHNHREYVTEEFTFQPPKDFSGEYRSHEKFTRFRSYDFTRDDLEIVCDYGGMSFELQRIS